MSYRENEQTDRRTDGHTRRSHKVFWLILNNSFIHFSPNYIHRKNCRKPEPYLGSCPPEGTFFEEGRSAGGQGFQRRAGGQEGKASKGGQEGKISTERQGSRSF